MSTAPPVPPPPPVLPWEPRQQQFVDRSRDHSLRLEAAAFANRLAVARIEKLQMWLDGSSIVLALWAMYAAYAISSLSTPGEGQKRLNDMVSVVGAGLSLVVLCLQIMSWRASWTPKAEKLRELAEKESAMAARFRTIIEAERFDETVFKRAESELRTLEGEEAHMLAVINRRFKQVGLRHVCQRHNRPDYKCNTCGRTWLELSKRRYAFKNWLRIWNCETCGVAR